MLHKFAIPEARRQVAVPIGNAPPKALLCFFLDCSGCQQSLASKSTLLPVFRLYPNSHLPKKASTIILILESALIKHVLILTELELQTKIP